MAEDSKEDTSWKNFLENTTIHGVKHIVGEGVRVRGICWLLCVLGAVAAFTYQVADRAIEYSKFESSVNMQMVYKDHVLFPEVTICNQNDFRLSKLLGIKDRKMFLFMNEVLNNNMTLDSTKDLARKLNIAELDTVLFLRTIAQSKGDLIESCKWKGQPCDIDQVFSPIITDMGVCYTFSPAKDQAQNDEDASVEAGDGDSTHSGARNGLRLLLNVEEYEYSQTSTLDPGLKILLHAENEFPLVGSLGFAVAPNSHTLVTVERTERSNMPEPWGECDMTKGKPMSNCMAECRLTQIMEACKCSDPYLQDLKGFVHHPALDGTVPTCDIPSTFSCIRSTIENLKLESTYCNCSLACEQELYYPSLSYAKLSHQNTARIVLKKEKQISETYMNATEERQKVFEEIVKSDNDMFDKIKNHSSEFTYLLKNAINMLNDPQEFREKYPNLVNLASAVREILSSDLAGLDKIRRKMNIKSYFRTTDPRGLRRWYLEISKDVIDRNQGNLDLFLFTALNKCLNSSSDGNSTYMLDCDKKDLGLYNSYFKLRKQESDKQLAKCKSMMKKAETNLIRYNNVINSFFGDSFVDPNSYAEHREVKYLVEHLNFSAIVMCRGLHVLSHNYSLEESISVVKEMNDTIDPWGYPANYQLVEKELDKGKWIKEIMVSRPIFIELKKLLKAWQSPLELTEVYLERVDGYLKAIQEYYLTKMKDFQSYIDDYKKGDMTKMELADKMAMKKIFKSLDIIDKHHKDLKDSITDYDRKLLYELKPYMKLAYHDSFNQKVPIFSNTVIRGLEILKQAEETSNEHLHKFLASMDLLKPSTTIGLIIDTVIEEYSNEIQRIASTLDSVGNDISSSLENLAKNLQTYHDDSKLNQKFFSKNYLTVDIFYKELRYAKVRQQETFAFLSLLGEVGGFMGLLLGASVLTLCELLDHIILSCVLRHCCVKKK